MLYRIFGLLSVWAALISLCCGVNGTEAPPREINSATLLVENGRPHAWIVYPSGMEEYRVHAEKIRRMVREKTGADLGILSDIEATDEKFPVLLEEFRGRNLILLGRLGINRAIWPVYNRFLCAVDGYYPGAGGYVVRTASNVYSNGANTIIVGGSDEAGAARGVDVFMGIIEKAPMERGRLELPWLLEVELGGQCKEIFDADESRQMVREFLEHGHAGNPSRRFYENIMSYYWSGRESYRDLGLRYLEHIVERSKTEKTPTHILTFNHYSDEFFVRAYNMIDESGILDSDMIREVDSLLLGVFSNNYEYFEAVYRRRLKNLTLDLKSYDHPNAAWLSDKVLCDFILDKMDVPDAIRKRAEERRQLVVNAFDMLIETRWQGCLLGQPYTDVATSTMFRYALEMDRYEEFFESDNARMAALSHLIRVENTRGHDIGTQWGSTFGRSHFKLYLSMCAGYYGDGEFKWIVENMPGGWWEPHYGRYVNRVHMYFPGAEVPAVKPSGELTGAIEVPLQDVSWRRVRQAHGMFGESDPEHAETFDFAAIRENYTRTGDHILLGGTARGYYGRADMPYPNAILRLTSKGTHYLVHSTSSLYYSQNALEIQDTAEWETEGLLPGMAKLSGISSAGKTGFLRSTVKDYSGINWTRNIAWLGDGMFAVLDELEALRDGEFMVSVNWHALHDASVDGLHWKVGNNPLLVLANSGGVTMESEGDRTLRQRALFRMKRGEVNSVGNFLYVNDAAGDTEYEVRKAGLNALMAVSDKGGIYYIGAPDMGWLDTDGKMVIISEDFLAVSGARRLKFFGEELMTADRPVGVLIDFRGAEAVISPADRQGGAVVTLKAGEPVSIKVTEKDSKFGLSLETTSEISKVTANRLSEKWALLPVSREETVGTIEIPAQLLERVWQSDAVLRPARTRNVKKIDDLTYDFGNVIELAEVRNFFGNLPAEIYYSEAELGRGTSGMKEFRGERKPWDSPRMSNYGHVSLLEGVGERIIADNPVRARYVRVSSEADLEFYDAGKPEARERVNARLIDLDGAGTPGIFIMTDVWPGMMSLWTAEHEIWVLNEDGSVRFNVPVHWRMLNAQALQWDGTGRHHIFISSLDGYVYVYSPDGELVRKFTLAGTDDLIGQPTPSVVGLWQPDDAGRRNVVVGRYHWCGFFDRNLEFIGHRRRHQYWTVNILAQGVDCTGDGVEDTITMTDADLRFFHGKDMTPGFYLPVYESEPIRHPTKSLLGGAKTLVFDIVEEAVPGPESRLIFVRENIAGIMPVKAVLGAYDGGTFKSRMDFTWLAPSPITAAAYRRRNPDIPGRAAIQLALTTGDGLLRIFDFDEEGSLAGYFSKQMPSIVEMISEGGEGFLLASNTGIYYFDMNGNLELLSPGRYVGVFPVYRAGGGKDIITVDAEGIVERLRWH